MTTKDYLNNNIFNCVLLRSFIKWFYEQFSYIIVTINSAIWRWAKISQRKF